MQPVFGAAFTLDVSTWQPGCAHPTLRLHAFVRLSPLPRPPAPAPSLCLLLQSAGVMSVYLFMKRYTAEDMYRPHPSFYRPRLSNCSDYSGQFLHPDAWVRGRSPSDISSDASLQMNSSYPALLKCPDYDQMSTSPC